MSAAIAQVCRYLVRAGRQPGGVNLGGRVSTSNRDSGAAPVVLDRAMGIEIGSSRSCVDSFTGKNVRRFRHTSRGGRGWRRTHRAKAKHDSRGKAHVVLPSPRLPASRQRVLEVSEQEIALERTQSDVVGNFDVETYAEHRSEHILRA